MRVIAYTAKRYVGATRRAVGGEAPVLTCPPLRDAHFGAGVGNHGVFADYDVAVLNLHGHAGLAAWYGDGGITALRAETLASQPGFSPGVFAINCYLGDPGHPMMRALWRAGAEWVIAGDGENYGSRNWPVVGADVLLWSFLRSLDGREPDEALRRAKRWTRLLALRLTADQRQALRDALDFKIHGREDGIHQVR